MYVLNKRNICNGARKDKINLSIRFFVHFHKFYENLNMMWQGRLCDAMLLCSVSDWVSLMQRIVPNPWMHGLVGRECYFLIESLCLSHLLWYLGWRSSIVIFTLPVKMALHLHSLIFSMVFPPIHCASTLQRGCSVRLISSEVSLYFYSSPSGCDADWTENGKLVRQTAASTAAGRNKATTPNQSGARKG